MILKDHKSKTFFEKTVKKLGFPIDCNTNLPPQLEKPY